MISTMRLEPPKIDRRELIIGIDDEYPGFCRTGNGVDYRGAVALTLIAHVDADRKVLGKAFQYDFGIVGAAILADNKFKVRNPAFKFGEVISNGLFDNERFVVDWKDTRNAPQGRVRRSAKRHLIRNLRLRQNSENSITYRA